MARTVVAPPSSVVKCFFVGGVRLGGWGVVLSVCVCVGGVVPCRCVCVCVCDLLVFLHVDLEDGVVLPAQAQQRALRGKVAYLAQDVPFPLQTLVTASQHHT